MITIFAHRGIHNVLPENTLKSFEEIKKYKNNDNIRFGIELDIQPTKYGELICYHDPDLSKLHGGPTKTYELTTKDLELYNIPTIDQVINCFENTDYTIDFELKFYNDLHNDNDIIFTCNLITKKLSNKNLNFFISSFNFQSLLHMSQISNYNLYLISNQLPTHEYSFATHLNGIILRKNLFLHPYSPPDKIGIYTIFDNPDPVTWEDDTFILKNTLLNNKTHLFIITDNVPKCLEISTKII